MVARVLTAMKNNQKELRVSRAHEGNLRNGSCKIRLAGREWIGDSHCTTPLSEKPENRLLKSSNQSRRRYWSITILLIICNNEATVC